MTVTLKTTFAWLTMLFLLVTILTLKYQIETMMFPLVAGIIGALLMFATEFMYSYRKREIITFGPLNKWLRIHIVMGIVGPIVILVHTRLNFYGFAGWLTLLTLVVFLSGIVGRYFYRRVARDSRAKPLLAKWRKFHIPLTLTLLLGMFIHVASVLYFGKIGP